MSKMWRERIAEARERGEWTNDDQARYSTRRTCLAADVAGRYGVAWESAMFSVVDEKYLVASNPWARLWQIGDAAGTDYTQGGISSLRDPASVDSALDRIEDAALEIKRRAR